MKVDMKGDMNIKGDMEGDKVGGQGGGQGSNDLEYFLTIFVEQNRVSFIPAAASIGHRLFEAF